MLTDRYLDGIPDDSRAAKPHGFLDRAEITDHVVGTVRRLRDVARTRGQSVAQLALAWVLRHAGVTSVLIGASRVAQIDECVGALDASAFTDDELQEIDRILAG